MNTDIDLLARQLELHPREDSLASMLLDALIETGMPPDQATALVVAIRAETSRAAELAQATHLMRAGSSTARRLGSECRRMLGVPSLMSSTILIVPGEAVPHVTSITRGESPGRTFDVWITVGCRYICNRHAALLAHRRERRRQLRAIRSAR